VQSGSDGSEDEDHISKKGKRGNDDYGALKTDALQAGKRYAVCDLLWIDPVSIQYLGSISKTSSETESLSDGLEDVNKEAQSILKSLPAPLRPHVGTKWFRERVRSKTNLSCRSSDHYVAV
jgi:hypothetical protein